MKITNNHTEETNSTNLKPGDVFIFDGGVFMRLKDDPNTISNTVELKTGDTYYMASGCKVIKVDAELIIK